MQRVTALDEALSKLFGDFRAVAASLSFTPICDLDDEATIASLHYQGIYKIDIRTGNTFKDFTSWYQWFHGEWVRDEYERMHVPNPKKKRVRAHVDKPLPEWVPLYLGKSRDIAGRILGHLHLQLSQPTTALKIRARSNMRTQAFRLSVMRLDVDNYDLIMPQMEGVLRDIHNPILGRQ